MNCILVPVDFSAVTPSVVETAASTARAFSASLALLHVAAPDPDFVGYDVGPVSVRDAVARRFRREHAELERMKQDLASRGLSVTTLLIQGPTTDKILRERERLGADLIIVGSHGHGALHHLLVGSVTEGVVRHSPCPVMIVPARKASG